MTEQIWFRATDEASPPLLEGRLRRPASRPARPRIAVLCHPHPAFGAHMDVWLLPTIGARLAQEGWTVLRFNVRGVGRSEPGPGTWDGSSERHDLAGALAAARDQVDDAPERVAIVGWSFGALLGLLHGVADPSVTDWVGIGPPTRPVDALDMVPLPYGEVRAWSARRTVVVGEHDQFFPPDTVEALAPAVVHVVSGADHFLFDRDREVADLVASALSDKERA